MVAGALGACLGTEQGLGGKHDPLAVGRRQVASVAACCHPWRAPQRRGEDGTQKVCGKPP